ncbi:hypothetical protein [Sulfurisoma sediminicola]|uniref:hypothetical protein n=1 Tax=Sulfurisoma sediminicola TaxID=1381557 RepID=UPI001A9EE02E|nr:hypothetical protein [Sulfurisoma sediminicola]
MLEHAVVHGSELPAANAVDVLDTRRRERGRAAEGREQTVDRAIADLETKAIHGRGVRSDAGKESGKGHRQMAAQAVPSHVDCTQSRGNLACGKSQLGRLCRGIPHDDTEGVVVDRNRAEWQVAETVVRDKAPDCIGLTFSCRSALPEIVKIDKLAHCNAIGCNQRGIG